MPILAVCLFNHPREASMDFLFLAIAACMFVAMAGLVSACDRLGERKRPGSTSWQVRRRSAC